MVVPDELIIAFFREATSRLPEIDLKATIANATEHKSSDSHIDLPDCQRCILDHQKIVLKEVTERFQNQLHDGIDTANNAHSDTISHTAVQERLGQLQHEPDLSQELKDAMEEMNDAARVAICKLILYVEEKNNVCHEEKLKTSSRNLQDEGRLERTKLMEYFVLCKASLKLQCVIKFMNMTGGNYIFEEAEYITERNSDEFDNKNSSMMFPQSRLEYVQRLLAKGIGWDPSFVTSELRKIFVEKPADVDYNYYDNDVFALFQQLMEEMQSSLQLATQAVRSKQEIEMLNDLGKGGNTRVVSVQYSEFEVDQNGKKINSSLNAPENRIDERQQMTEEEKKRNLRLASEAAVLQQTILGELLAMNEDERNLILHEAAEASREFMEEAMALPMGQERIDFLRSVDAATSRKLAMHKLWEGMLQANGGKPPNIVGKK